MITKIKQHRAVRISLKIITWKMKLGVLLLLPLIAFTLLTSNTDFINGMKSFVVLTGSMEPSVGAGSIVYTQKNASYLTNDIITFTNSSKQTVTHRISSIKQDSSGIKYQTKGDANRYPDSEWVAYSQILGKVSFTVPYAGKLIIFTKTPQGFIAAVIVPAVIFVFWELWNIKREIEKQVEKKVMERVQSTANI